MRCQFHTISTFRDVKGSTKTVLINGFRQQFNQALDEQNNIFFIGRVENQLISYVIFISLLLQSLEVRTHIYPSTDVIIFFVRFYGVSQPFVDVFLSVPSILNSVLINHDEEEGEM